jgi:hypothetical protein
MELFQERVKELEYGATPNRATFRPGARDSIVVGDELRGLGTQSPTLEVNLMPLNSW